MNDTNPWVNILEGNSDSSSCFGLMLKLKLQYFGHLIKRADSLDMRRWCWERLKTRGEEDDRGWNGGMVSLTQWTWVWVNSGSWWRIGRPWGAAVHGGHKESDMTERLNWTELYVNNINTCIRKNRRRQWHPTPVLLPGKSHGQRSLVGCSPWGR